MKREYEFPALDVKNPEVPVLSTTSEGWRSHSFDELQGKCIGILFTTRHTYISVSDSVLFRD